MPPSPQSWHALAPEPWKNGGGSTRTLAVSRELPGTTHTAEAIIPTSLGHADIDARANWRVSIAEIVRDGTYSSFPGYERLSVVLSGAGVVLRHEDTLIELRPGVPTVFDGAPAWQSTLLDGPVSVLNLFVRQGCVQAVVAHERGPSDAGTTRHLGTLRAQGGPGDARSSVHPAALPSEYTRIVVTTAAQHYQCGDEHAPLALQGNEFWIESHAGCASYSGLHAVVISLREHCPL